MLYNSDKFRLHTFRLLLGPVAIDHAKDHHYYPHSHRARLCSLFAVVYRQAKSRGVPGNAKDPGRCRISSNTFINEQCSVKVGETTPVS